MQRVIEAERKRKEEMEKAKRLHDEEMQLLERHERKLEVRR